MLSCNQLSVSPWTVACQAPLSTGFPKPEYWSGLPFPSLRDCPDPGIEPASPALAGRFFTTEPSGSPLTAYLDRKFFVLEVIADSGFTHLRI